MSKLIQITRSGSTVNFPTVNVVTTDLVVWQNLDPQQTHWPSLSLNQLGAAPSPNSNDTPLAAPPGVVPSPNPKNYAFQVSYTCTLHSSEKGLINVFKPFQAGTPVTVAGKTTLNFVVPLPPATATQGQPIPDQLLAAGGMSPYIINSLEYQVAGQQPAFGTLVPATGAATFLGLTLTPDNVNNGGLTLSGTPNVSGKIAFVFDVTDAMGLNIQQSQFTMVVS